MKKLTDKQIEKAQAIAIKAGVTTIQDPKVVRAEYKLALGKAKALADILAILMPKKRVSKKDEPEPEKGNS